MNEEIMLKWFEYQHLPKHLQEVSRPFWNLATTLCDCLLYTSDAADE